MKRALIFLPVLALMSVIPTQASAKDANIYGGLFIGDRLGEGQTFEGANIAGAPRVIQTPTKDGLVGGAMIGVVVADANWGRIRTEAELSAGKNDIRRLTLNGVQRELLSGRKSVTTTMLNVAYDTPKIWDRIRFTVGGGAGAASIDYDIEYNVAAAGPRIQIPTNATGKLALQAIGGVSFEVAKNFELTADARYLHVGKHNVERYNFSTGTLDSVLRTDYDSTSITAGLRFFF